MCTPEPKKLFDKQTKVLHEASVHKMRVNQLMLKMHIAKSTTTKHIFRN
jgi:hypothetical protein